MAKPKKCPPTARQVTFLAENLVHELPYTFPTTPSILLCSFMDDLESRETMACARPLSFKSMTYVLFFVFLWFIRGRKMPLHEAAPRLLHLLGLSWLLAVANLALGRAAAAARLVITGVWAHGSLPVL